MLRLSLYVAYVILRILTRWIGSCRLLMMALVGLAGPESISGSSCRIHASRRQATH